MADFNKVMLLGRLTRDPDVKYTTKGTAVGNLSLAVNRTYQDAQGRKTEEVCYVDVEVWGRQAETCKEYLAKGREIFVEGHLKFEQWEKDGKKHSRIKVRAERVQFIGGKQEGGGTGRRDYEPDERADRRARQVQSGRSYNPDVGPDDDDHPAPPGDDDDIPF